MAPKPTMVDMLPTVIAVPSLEGRHPLMVTTTYATFATIIFTSVVVAMVGFIVMRTSVC